MKIATRDFGEVQVEERDLLTFLQPIFGFEQLKRFVVLMDDSLDGEFLWLQSVEDSAVCFVLACPEKMVPGYAVDCPKDICKALGEGVYETWLVMVVAEDFQCSTVNLKSPVFINLSKNTAAQAILEEEYPIRYPLFMQGGEEKAC